ncbi:putative RNA-binding Zn ribbon-like protein [Rhizobium sp. BK529]|uniref:CGNR zinc finger domain-containing protein n=1 Tax=Rhizobium sp. BK529 TaxID=2586983 RepID=UPI0017FE9DD0|nr:CGNR zinc finger domain-containing protein [Rhizobium sp. BK529]MBB3595871.1 putative RNA-binding Zn ribbon-like protein [Rhizobium sp. BK529]
MSTRMNSKAKAGGPKEDLAISFVNTAAWRLRAAREERLPDAHAFLRWMAANVTGDSQHLEAIRERWHRIPDEADSLYETIIALREAIYEVLVARLANRPAPVAALDFFNGLLARSADGIRLKGEAGEIIWSIDGASDIDLLRPVITSAAALMTGPKAHRVRQCQDERGCGWLFIDESRALNRRWCSMGDCGNRAKARRHYLRSRAD